MHGHLSVSWWCVLVQIKQNVLLKYKYMIQFLRHNSKDIFAEVSKA